MSTVFCEFSLFVNIKHLDNIRDNKLNHVFLIYFFYTEKRTDRVLFFNQNGLVLERETDKNFKKAVQYLQNFINYTGDEVDHLISFGTPC